MLTLYTRPGCSLCETAKRRLQAAGVGYHERDVSGNPALEERYGADVPVLEDAVGRVLVKGVFGEARLAAVLLGS